MKVLVATLEAVTGMKIHAISFWVIKGAPET
jgi:hypothetical protein